MAVAIDHRGVRPAEHHAPATSCGYGALERWARSLGPVCTFGIEGSGSYGTGLTRYLTAKGYTVGRGPLHMVSAWATENRMVLGQTRTSAHSNEITAIPELLRVLELKGCLVTIDAMGCQKDIARQVVQGGAGYLLAVKANQGELHENIKDCLPAATVRDGMAWPTATTNRWARTTDDWKAASAG